MTAKYTQMQNCQGESAQNPRWAQGSDENLSATRANGLAENGFTDQ